jgi:GntR family transcriptional regulator
MATHAQQTPATPGTGREAGAPAAEGPKFSPLYRQIKALLLTGLESGEWKPGEAIPSETDLAARYRVSQGTVRKAIDELAAEYLLVRRQGKGTFVATHDETHSQYRFLRLRPLEGEEQYPESRLLECRRARASGEVARMLELRLGESVMVLKRVLLFRGQPTVLDEVSLPGALFKGLSAAMVNQYGVSLYSLFESEFGTRMIRADERIRAVPADAEAATVLQVKERTPLLCVERVAFSYGERPVEFRRGLYRTDAHYYANTLA